MVKLGLEEWIEKIRRQAHWGLEIGTRLNDVVDFEWELCSLFYGDNIESLAL